MNVARAAHTATLLPSGRVLIAGGTVVDGSAPALVSEIYDGGASMAVAGSTLAAEDHQAVLLDTGKILLVGGHDHAGTALAITQVFDPVSQSFSAAADTAVARDGATATRLVDGSVLIAGGDGPNASAWLTSERFSPATDVIAPGHTGTPFNVTLAGFGAASNSFTIKSGALPPGLALNAATRQIAGTPTATGVYRVVVEIGDSSNLVRTVLRTVTIQIN
jgi:glyoxylase-like metal-dependent hydrolase (beta-lactamase superfamily II)